jgi:polyhydroxyalkanoate synthesis regulator phasin
METVQDPQKRAQSLSELTNELSQKAAEWEEKGEVTEQEARRFIDAMLQQRSSSGSSSSTRNSTVTEPIATPTKPTAAPNVQQEIEALTTQISAIRTELEKLRQSESNS